MKALIIGATGATGKDLVNVLLQDSNYTSVVMFVRRPTKLTHSKLSEVITDFENLDVVSEFIKGDVLFSCMGTTLKDAGSKDKQWHIDYEIPLKFAAIARSNGVPATVLVSAYGALSTSKVFYSSLKGKLEDAIAALAFDQFIIFQPGMLLRKNTERPAERIVAGLLNFFAGIGIARKFKPLPTSILAEKLAKAPNALTSGKHIIALEKVWKF